MEIKFSGKEIESIILKHAQTICPQMNTVRGDSYRSTPDLIITYVLPEIENEIDVLRKENAEQKTYITCMESPS